MCTSAFNKGKTLKFLGFWVYKTPKKPDLPVKQQNW